MRPLGSMSAGVSVMEIGAESSSVTLGSQLPVVPPMQGTLADRTIGARLAICSVQVPPSNAQIVAEGGLESMALYTIVSHSVTVCEPTRSTPLAKKMPRVCEMPV